MRLIIIITVSMMNSASMRLKMFSSLYLVLDTNKEGITMPTILEASTAKVQIAVTAGLCVKSSLINKMRIGG